LQSYCGTTAPTMLQQRDSSRCQSQHIRCKVKLRVECCTRERCRVPRFWTAFGQYKPACCDTTSACCTALHVRQVLVLTCLSVTGSGCSHTSQSTCSEHGGVVSEPG
jgi:superfamily II DNA helicase RecQ